MEYLTRMEGRKPSKTMCVYKLYVKRHMGSCEGKHESKGDEDDGSLQGTRDS